MAVAEKSSKRLSRWYFGGLGSAGACCFTHPLDLVKVHLQTQQDKSMTMVKMAVKVVKGDGVRGLYNGLSASLVRQLTYSTTRFGVYYGVQQNILSPDGTPMPFYQKVLLAGFSGACGGVVGTPGDMVNVRMQNDMKLPPAQRRNYKNAIDGIIRVAREEGTLKLWNGCTMASFRAVFMTIGQEITPGVKYFFKHNQQEVGMYDQVKQMLLASGVFGDNLLTHFTASTLAATIATTITQPLDVMKTRMMNAKPGEFKGIGDCFLYTLKAGPTAFYKGYIPALTRLAPQTVLTFVFFEQLRLNFGYFPGQK